MKLIDTNLLLYAINADCAQHEAASQWLEDVLNDDEPVGLPWAVITGFLRISTNPRALPSPLSAKDAVSIVDGWLAMRYVRQLQPKTEHWRILQRLLAEAGTAGNLTTDAHLAAIAIEHGAQLCSTDSDFGRFKQLSWINPIAG